MTVRMAIGCGMVCDALLSLSNAAICGLGQHDPGFAPELLMILSIAVPAVVGLATLMLQPFENQSVFSPAHNPMEARPNR